MGEAEKGKNKTAMKEKEKKEVMKDNDQKPVPKKHGNDHETDGEQEGEGEGEEEMDTKRMFDKDASNDDIGQTRERNAGNNKSGDEGNGKGEVEVVTDVTIVTDVTDGEE